MADKNYRQSENASGPFFVDATCIACDTCTTIAPQHFKLTDDSDHAYVFLQPETTQAQQQCTLALDSCPVSAIGRVI